jgi:SAM-dependent methyltransferase
VLGWRDALRTLFGILWRALPRALALRALAAAVSAEADRPDPAEALRALFSLSDVLDTAIGRAAVVHGGGVHPKGRLTGYPRYFIERIRPGEHVLDVGCGVGAVAHAIACACDADVLALDGSASQIETARALFTHPRLSFAVGRAPEAVPGGPRDVVILSNVLEHVDDRTGFLEAIVRRVSPRRVLIRVPLFDRSWTVPMRRELGIGYFSDDTHRAEKTADAWVQEIEAAGLAVTHRQTSWGELWCETAIAGGSHAGAADG